MNKINDLDNNSGFDKDETFYIETYGCQMNFSDSNDIRKLLIENGYKESPKLEKADIIVVNTCSVRETAEQRIHGRLSFLKKLKSIDDKILILNGCMAERLSDRLLYDFPDLDIVVGTHNKSKIAEVIKHYKSKKIKKAYTGFNGYVFSKAKADYKYPYKAFIPIIHGCNNFCSYCIVPFTRGREISRSSNQIIDNVKELVDKGVIEITLLGQNVNSYGKDIDDISFSLLLQKLNKIDGLKRIRFITSHPKDFTDELAHTIADSEKICNYLHLPFQSASDKVLQDMNRNYTFDKYRRIINYLKKLIPNINISTDILVGYPTETREDYKLTLLAMKDIEFDNAFMFKYNPREGTKAYTIKDVVPEEEKLSRLQEIISLQNEITKKKNKRIVGTIEDVLFDYLSKNSKEDIAGKTDTFKSVIVRGDDNLIGKIKKVKLISLSGNTFRGRILNR